jgi:hypothetical protein
VSVGHLLLVKAPSIRVFRDILARIRQLWAVAPKDPRYLSDT